MSTSGQPSEGALRRVRTYVEKYRQKTGVSLSTAFPRDWPNLLVNTAVYESVPQEVPAEVAAQSGHDIHMFLGLASAFEDSGGPIHVGDRGGAIPEPASFGLLGLAGLAAGAGARRRRKVA